MRVGIVGYGNLGRGVEAAVQQAGDMDLVAVFTRRDPASVTIEADAPVLPMEKMDEMEGRRERGEVKVNGWVK